MRHPWAQSRALGFAIALVGSGARLSRRRRQASSRHGHAASARSPGCSGRQGWASAPSSTHSAAASCSLVSGPRSIGSRPVPALARRPILASAAPCPWRGGCPHRWAAAAASNMPTSRNRPPQRRPAAVAKQGHQGARAGGRGLWLSRRQCSWRRLDRLSCLATAHCPGLAGRARLASVEHLLRGQGGRAHRRRLDAAHGGEVGQIVGEILAAKIDAADPLGGAHVALQAIDQGQVLPGPAGGLRPFGQRAQQVDRVGELLLQGQGQGEIVAHGDRGRHHRQRLAVGRRGRAWSPSRSCATPSALSASTLLQVLRHQPRRCSAATSGRWIAIIARA